MKAQSRCGVELEVRVVHPVQTPQRRDGMEHDVLQIDGQIEKQHGQDNGQPIRRADSVE